MKPDTTKFEIKLGSVSNEMLILRKTVDEEKLKNIGNRNVILNVEDNIYQEKRVLNDAIIEKQKELSRHQTQLESLQFVETDQLSFIDAFENI